MTSLPSRLCLALLAAGLPTAALAEILSPVGAWTTIDD